MPKHRFFVPPTQIKNDHVVIRGTDVWHITKVLRLEKGAEILVFDGTGREYRVILDRPRHREAHGTVVEQWTRMAESPLKLTLVQGIPKAQKMDTIVQKATEIGVHEIIPLHTERSVWNTKQKQEQNTARVHQRLERWSRIAIEAAKQSCRTAVPLIRPVETIEDFLASRLAADLKIFLWEEEQHVRLTQVVQDTTDAVHSAIIVVGPEGGFTPAEAAQFQANDHHSISLGQRILRTETASLVVLGILQFAYGDY